MHWIWIGMGGAIGSVLRFYLGGKVQSSYLTLFPLGTLAVNLIGSTLIGLLAGIFEHYQTAPHWRVFLVVGLLGGFTTFSAFSLENLSMIRAGQVRTMLVYVALSNGLGISLAVGGFFLGKALMRALGQEG
jgi:fluoride exporter